MHWVKRIWQLCFSLMETLVVGKWKSCVIPVDVIDTPMLSCILSVFYWRVHAGTFWNKIGSKLKKNKLVPQAAQQFDRTIYILLL